LRDSERIILAAIKKYWNVYRSAVTVSQLQQFLSKEGYSYSVTWIRTVLDNLIRKGYVEKIGSRPARYKPKAGIVPLTHFIKEMHTSAEVSEKLELKESETTEMIAEYIEDKLLKQPMLLKYIEEEALNIGKEDPVEVAISLIDYLCRATYEGVRGIKHTEILDVADAVVRKYFAFVLGVPTKLNLSRKKIKGYSIEDLCGRASQLLGPIAAIGIGSRAISGVGTEKVIAYDRENLRKYLRWRFLSDKIVSEIPISRRDEIIYISGHDTSFWPIVLDPSFFSGELHLPISTELYILAGIRFSTWRETRGNEIYAVAEVEPHPSDFPYLHSREAITRGYLVTPEMIEESEGSRRIVEAAMNLLEYNILNSALTSSSFGRRLTLYSSHEEGKDESSRPLTYPRPLFHDGRLFPYEHKLSDYVGGYGGWHPKIVRLSIKAFSDVVRSVVGDKRVLVVGVIKQPRAPYLHPLIIWLLRKLGRINEEEFWRTLKIFIYDRFEVAALLRGLSKKRPPRPGYTYATVPVMRRYWAMDESIMRAYVMTKDVKDNDEYYEEFWLRKPIFSADQLTGEEEPGLRGYLRSRGIGGNADEVLSYVLANATAILTYVLPPENSIKIDARIRGLTLVIPRYEILVQPPRLYGFDLGKYREYIRSVLSGVALPNILEGYGRYLFRYEITTGGDERRHRRVATITVLPYHVVKADEYSKKYDSTLREMYFNELLQAIARVVREGRKAQVA